MTNDEWEVFKKEVKPLKKSGVIKKSIANKPGLTTSSFTDFLQLNERLLNA